MRIMKILLSVFTVIVIGIFGLAFLVLFNKTGGQDSRTIITHNAADVRRVIQATSGDEKIQIYFKRTPLTGAVKSKTNDGFTLDDGKTYSYKDIEYIMKGTAPFLHGYDWQAKEPIQLADKIVIPSQTITFDVQHPSPPFVGIRTKGEQNFTTSENITANYDQVVLIVKKMPQISFIQRLKLTWDGLPSFSAWAFADLITIIQGHGG